MVKYPANPILIVLSHETRMITRVFLVFRVFSAEFLSFTILLIAAAKNKIRLLVASPPAVNVALICVLQIFCYCSLPVIFPLVFVHFNLKVDG